MDIRDSYRSQLENFVNGRWCKHLHFANTFPPNKRTAPSLTPLQEHARVASEPLTGSKVNRAEALPEEPIGIDTGHADYDVCVQNFQVCPNIAKFLRHSFTS